MKVSFVVLGKPQGKARPRSCRRGEHSHIYTPNKNVRYENYIRLCYKDSCKVHFADKPLKMTVQAFYSIPKAFSRAKTKQAMEGLLKPCTKPDIDNVVKSVCDALNNTAYSDDKSIVSLTATKLYSNEPRLEIEIESLE